MLRRLNLAELSRRCRTDRRGNIAVTTAILSAAMVTFGGCFLDVAQEQVAGNQMQNAADTASLAGAKAGNDWLTNVGSDPANQALALTRARTVATQTFNSDMQGTTLNVTPAVNASFDGSQTTVTVNASGVFHSNFLRMVGVNQINMRRSSTSVANFTLQYYQVIFLADVSGSMGIGGTTAAINQLQSMWGCAFACHDPNHYYSGTDWRAVARQDGIPLKVDYENQAIQTFMTQLSGFAQNYPGRFSVSIYTYATNFHTIQAPTTNLTAASTAAQSIDMEPIGPAATNWGYTYTSNSLSTVKQLLTNVGDGSAPNRMKTYLVFVSDGVEDTPNPGGPYGRKMDLTYPTVCAQLKNANVSVFTIWTHYYPVNDAQYNYFITPISSQIPQTMQSCASDISQYYEASDGPGIVSAVNSAFQSITSQARLRVSS